VSYNVEIICFILIKFVKNYRGRDLNTRLMVKNQCFLFSKVKISSKLNIKIITENPGVSFD